MTDNPDQSEVRDLPDGLTLALHAGDNPSLIRSQEDAQIRVQLLNVRAVVAALTEAAADLTPVLAGVIYDA